MELEQIVVEERYNYSGLRKRVVSWLGYYPQDYSLTETIWSILILQGKETLLLKETQEDVRRNPEKWKEEYDLLRKPSRPSLERMKESLLGTLYLIDEGCQNVDRALSFLYHSSRGHSFPMDVPHDWEALRIYTESILQTYPQLERIGKKIIQETEKRKNCPREKSPLSR